MTEPDMLAETAAPTGQVTVREAFGIDTDLVAPSFVSRGQHVPTIDPDYLFDPETTLSILAGFAHNRRVMLTGFHGTGKSTHIEQVAARLNWPCVRINLDSHVGRTELVGRDAIVLKDGAQVTEFREGILPWALQRPCALVFDEYDAGRPDVMFVIQRVLEADGRLTLLDESRVIEPHPSFRLFSTANTVGLGDPSGMYQGTQQLNQGQMDRWDMIVTLDYLPHEKEVGVIVAKSPWLAAAAKGEDLAVRMVRFAEMTRTAFANGDLGVLMSTRSLISWAENARILGNLDIGLRVTFLNKCDRAEQNTVREFFQRCFGRELTDRPGTLV